MHQPTEVERRQPLLPGLPDDLVWMGRGVAPNEEEIERAIAVLSAVPLAGAAGWSVKGHPWSSHARRLRTAIVRPSGEWKVSVMRGVREVDGLHGPVLVRRRHLERIEVDPGFSGDPVAVMAHAMRSAGFRLLLMDHS
ncbi:MAG: hypothetical protein GY812_02395 [Actinomycetia bacterium]|nr:hypothetical protein [Actinomycetes bacterium]